MTTQMNEAQVELVSRVQDFWVKAENAATPNLAGGFYQAALGLLKQAAAVKPPCAEIYGFGSRFLLFGAYFYANQAKNMQQAQTFYQLSGQYVLEALKLDPREFTACFVWALRATDDLGDAPPSYAQAAFDNSQSGGFVTRLIKTGFDRGRFSKAQQEFFKAVAAALDAFSTKSKLRGYFIEDLVSHMDDLLRLVDAVSEYNFDLSEVLRVVASTNEDFSNYGYYTADEEELQKIVGQYMDLRENAAARLAAL